MSAAQKWPASDTLTLNTTKSPHNCPYCRCLNEPPPTLYSSPFSQTSPHNFRPQNPYFSSTFPSRQGNVVFSYMSPTKLERYHSSDGRFSTKRYKHEHFPFIGRISESEAPIFSLPARPAASKQKMSLAYVKQPLPAGGNAAEMFRNKKYDQQKGQQEEHLLIGNRSERTLQSNGDVKSTPIQYLKQLPKQQQLRNKGQGALNSEEERRAMGKEAVANKYPTVKSIDIFEQRPGPSESLSSSPSYTSLRVAEMDGGVVGSPTLPCRQDNGAIASSISEELELHYDYYTPLGETDQSLSIGLSL